MSKHSKHDGEKRADDVGLAPESASPEARARESDEGQAPRQPKTAESQAGSCTEAIADLGSEFAAAKTEASAAKARAETLEAELSSLKDQYLRKLADYENFRKRMQRDKEDAVQYANGQLLSDLVGVLDDFDRAVTSSETSKDFQSLHDGVDMIRKRLLGLLEGKYGLSRFDSSGSAFDPNMHEAVMSEQGDCDEPVVVEEFVKGYKLRDRVLRSAKVKVRMPAAPHNEETRREENA